MGDVKLSIFGMNVKEFCSKHSKEMFKYLDNKDVVPTGIVRYHLEKIKWLQHERLVHLIVMSLTLLIEIILFSVISINKEISIVYMILAVGVGVLSFFYVLHYFYLENTVQNWYIIGDYLMEHSDYVNDKN